MGEVELQGSRMLVHAHIITYGNASDPEVTERLRSEIESMWNEPAGMIRFQNHDWLVQFIITATWKPAITNLEVISNTNPRNNYFRVEEFAQGNISFVDGLGCNTGYFKWENLYEGSTTAAHEFGHTLGLHHPPDLDIRGRGRPGIMYPRGTLVDPEFQYDPSKPAGVPGGTMHPMHRRVRQEDIRELSLNRLDFENGFGILGEFSNVWHPDHASLGDYGLK
jgi:hypothetical protein